MIGFRAGTTTCCWAHRRSLYLGLARLRLMLVRSKNIVILGFSSIAYVRYRRLKIVTEVAKSSTTSLLWEAHICHVSQMLFINNNIAVASL